jgi:hypothetical protein
MLLVLDSFVSWRNNTLTPRARQYVIMSLGLWVVEEEDIPFTFQDMHDRGGACVEDGIISNDL